MKPEATNNICASFFVFCLIVESTPSNGQPDLDVLFHREIPDGLHPLPFDTIQRRRCEHYKILQKQTKIYKTSKIKQLMRYK